MGSQDDSPVRRTTAFDGRLFTPVGAMIVVVAAVSCLSLFSQYRTAVRENEVHPGYPVVELELAEVGVPFPRTGGTVVVVALVLTVLGTVVVRRDGKPVPRRVERDEARFRRLFEDSPVPMFESSIQGPLLAVNKAVLALTGFSRDELEGKDVRDFYQDSGERERFRSLLEAQGTVQDFRAQLKRADGSYGTFSISAALVQAEEGGSPTIQTVAIDLADQMEAEKSLRASEGLLRALTEASPDHILLLDHDLRVEYLSRPAPGFTLEDVLGTPILDHLPDEDKDRVARTLRAVLETGKRGIYETTHLAPDGERHHFETHVGPYRPEGEITGLVLNSRDISEMRRLQRQVLEVSELERQNAGEMLHDTVGQEVSGIAMLASSLAQDLRKNGETEQAHEAARVGEMAEEAALRVRELARGLFPVHLKEFGIDASLEALARDLTGRESVECLYTLEGGDPELDDEGAIQLYRICQEACRNAVRHASASSISITLRAMGGELVLAVEDDGSGLPPDKERGIGMGLSMMRHRAATIGASIEITCGESGGTRVICRMETTAGGRTHG